MTNQPAAPAEHAPCFECQTSPQMIHRPWDEVKVVCRECIAKQPKTCPKCGSEKLVTDSRGQFHFNGGAVDDDVEDYLVCTECGEVVA